MERHLTLAVAFAAALHAALLFGFPKTARVILPKDASVTFTRFDLVRAEPEPVTEVGSENPSAGPAKANSVPQRPEPPPLDVQEGFTMSPPFVDVRITIATDTIPNVTRNFFPGDREGEGPGRMPLGSELDDTPRTRFQPAPAYSFEGRREGLRGEVYVEFMVDEAGRVVNPRVVPSSNRMFEEPTLRAVSRWQLEPGRRAGRVVRFKMAVPVIINLND